MTKRKIIQSVFERAKEILLTPSDLTIDQLQKVLSRIMNRKMDYADLYFQLSHGESWLLEDGIVKDAHFGIERGVGIRAVSDEKTGLAYTDEIQWPALLKAADAAKYIAKQGKKTKRVKIFNQVKDPTIPLYHPLDPLLTLTEVKKVDLLRRVDQEARQQDARVSEVLVSLSGTYEVVLIIASDGTLAADVRPLVRMNVSVIVEQNGRREHGSAGGGGRFGYDFFLNQDKGLIYAKEAVRQALVNLEAVNAPAGLMPVILGPGWPAVLLHEAVGHGLEGDFNRKGSSAFTGKLGKKVASSLCTVVDDGTLIGRRGSLNVDDEGTPTQQTVLIEKGILKGYLQDKMNARLMGTLSTGNARRQTYADIPLPRMTNTYMLPGSHQPDEIISSVKKGLYAVNFSGGQVDITSGKFVFSTSEAYLIEKGKIGAPVKDATLIGDGPTILKKVSMVGCDLQLDDGIGVCGKDGQSVPVGVGQPTLKVNELTVGGTS